MNERRPFEKFIRYVLFMPLLPASVDLGLSVRPFICLFVRTDIVATICHERLEQF